MSSSNYTKTNLQASSLLDQMRASYQLRGELLSCFCSSASWPGQKLAQMSHYGCLGLGLLDLLLADLCRQLVQQVLDPAATSSSS